MTYEEALQDLNELKEIVKHSDIEIDKVQAVEFAIQLIEGVNIARRNFFFGDNDYIDGYKNCLSDIGAVIDDLQDW